jgi:hypothetical protein
MGIRSEALIVFYGVKCNLGKPMDNNGYLQLPTSTIATIFYLTDILSTYDMFNFF